MAEQAPPRRRAPQVYSIAAHRGFADALVAGLVPRYFEEGVGLARLTLLLPSSRMARTLSEAFIRYFGAQGEGTRTGSGLLMPRMAMVGDLDLDEALGPMLDPLGAGDEIAPAVDPTRRWLRLAELIRDERGEEAPRGSALLRLAFETGRVMDRLLAEEITPDELLGARVLDLLDDLAGHWQDNLHLFARVHRRWLAELEERGEVEATTRRNLLFRRAARRWREEPPPGPIVAAGVTSAAPALAAMLRTVSELAKGAVVLPDFDLSMPDEVWDELGSAGATQAEPPFQPGDAVTHPQYHLKLLLNRMGVGRGEVQQWHRAGLGKGPPARSLAISSLFLPPRASRSWVDLPSDRRRLAGIHLITSANLEEEAQAIALLAREALETPGRRVAVVTPDRGLAARVVHHLRRWNVEADDSAGRPLPQTTAGRLFLLLAEVAAERAAPVPLLALLEHPLVDGGEDRGEWLGHVRAFEQKLRGPRPAPGLEPLRPVAEKAGLVEWWSGIEAVLAPLCAAPPRLADLIDALAAAGEALCGEAMWAREDGRALAQFVEDLRLHADEIGTALELEDAPAALREAMERIAVRPSYGGHPRVAIYGLLESRGSRADLMICAGLNEGTWPARPSTDPLLAPPVLRALGVPGADFRIGLAAHDLAGAMGAPEVVLSHADRDLAGPTIPSRFLLRVRALLGELLDDYKDKGIIELARALDATAPIGPYPVIPAHPRPEPMPNAQQRKVALSVTGLDRLRSDPYQFYASSILGLRELDPLDATPSPAWQGELAHLILEDWHNGKGDLETLMDDRLTRMNAHPLTRAMWRPRLARALAWVAARIEADPTRRPVLFEETGAVEVRGVTIKGKADRIDRLADGTLAVVDYKTGRPPSGREVEAGYALQLGTLGIMAEQGAFGGLAGDPVTFEYWSLGKSADSETGFGYVTTPLKVEGKRTGMAPQDFLPEARRFLNEALDLWILGEEPFKARLNPDAPGYGTYDHLMRLDEWVSELTQ